MEYILYINSNDDTNKWLKTSATPLLKNISIGIQMKPPNKGCA